MLGGEVAENCSPRMIDSPTGVTVKMLQQQADAAE